jgi:oxygen-independent coproporphyrinogen III oxidase
MAGIYIHIPFCKQACHYCDFHFSTSQTKKSEMILALANEIEMRKNEFQKEIIETIYFGGGTPSLLDSNEIEFLLAAVYQNYQVITTPEITLEANPDDLTDEKIIQLSTTKINRLSIGIQSFFDDDLKMMNRSHHSAQAKKCLETATRYFNNISVDLIYGIPGMSNEKWMQNIETVLDYNIPHISCYALTVEPKTALKKLIATGKIAQPKEEVAQEHFDLLVEKLTQNDFVHYEVSNFGKENYFSRNNSGYWLGKKYLGIGPSAHSFDGKTRSWNIANNTKYIQSIQKKEVPQEVEILTPVDVYNEYIMTGLRTIWGVSFDKIKDDFGRDFLNYLEKQSQKFIENQLLFVENKTLKTTQKGKFLTDGIASDLFFVNKEI